MFAVTFLYIPVGDTTIRAQPWACPWASTVPSKTDQLFFVKGSAAFPCPASTEQLFAKAPTYLPDEAHFWGRRLPLAARVLFEKVLMPVFIHSACSWCQNCPLECGSLDTSGLLKMDLQPTRHRKWVPELQPSHIHMCVHTHTHT